MIHHTVISSPMGDILLIADNCGLTTINFQSGCAAKKPPIGSIESSAPFREASRQISAYFKGERIHFDLPLLAQGTPFQKSVWAELVRIPYGETISYRELAMRVGKPAAWRAVGSANGRNPLPIVVPCHRVIGSDGKLSGYNGGVHLKKYLLQIESKFKPLLVPSLRSA